MHHACFVKRQFKKKMFKILHARVTEVTRKIITMEESIKQILSGDDIIDDVPKK